MTDFNKLTPHNATAADLKRLLIRELMHGEWKLAERSGYVFEYPVLINTKRPIEVRVRTGSVRLDGVRISGFNWCIAREAKAWVRRHLFSDLSGAPCETKE